MQRIQGLIAICLQHHSTTHPLAYSQDMSDKDDLEAAIGRRLGQRGNASQLADAYLSGVEAYAIERTTANGPVPTSLPVERAAMLFEVCQKLGRVIEDYEIEALLRLPPALAKAVRRTLLATYPDSTNSLIVAWAIQGAKYRGKFELDFVGHKIQFADSDRRDGYKEVKQREGIKVQDIVDEQHPWSALVDENCITAKALAEEQQRKKKRTKSK